METVPLPRWRAPKEQPHVGSQLALPVAPLSLTGGGGGPESDGVLRNPLLAV